LRVFITGLSGSLGTALARLHHARGDRVAGCSRSEARGVAWLRENGHLGTLLILDADDLGGPRAPMVGFDRLYHCAALKHVDMCERQPGEAAWQNVWLTDNLAHGCEEEGVELVFASSDKACCPEGVYGASKLIAERCVVAKGGAAVRLVNLIGSSGSVFERWGELIKQGGRIKLTDPEMTRYLMPMDEAALLMADHALPGRVVAPRHARAAWMGDVAQALAPGRVDVTGRRPGETQHQWLVAPGEPYTDEDGRIVLGEGKCHAGLCSLTAPRWGAKELLAAAGLEV
jgi:UDP-N-acetylglucosamine 4,6-dehydratase